MINILGLKKGKRLMDPFCGFGNFLIEGLSKGYNVLGIDNDRNKVISSKKNLTWAASYFKYSNDFTVLNGDSSKLKFSADGVVFEPYMGPFISKLPNFLRAKSIVDSLNKLYSDLFRNLYDNLKPKTRVVCILPELKTYDDQFLRVSESVFLNNGFIFLEISKITKEVSIQNPIFYAAANESKINRYIYILERK
jgi:tRNA G10  N-methylase Trm11